MRIMQKVNMREYLPTQTHTDYRHMSAYMHTHAHTHTHTHTHTHKSQIHECMHTYTHMHMHIHMCVYISGLWSVKIELFLKKIRKKDHRLRKHDEQKQGAGSRTVNRCNGKMVDFSHSKIVGTNMEITSVVHAQLCTPV